MKERQQCILVCCGEQCFLEKKLGIYMFQYHTITLKQMLLYETLITVILPVGQTERSRFYEVAKTITFVTL